MTRRRREDDATRVRVAPIVALRQDAVRSGAPGTRRGTLSAADLVGLQRWAGNRAVGGLLAPARLAVQRCGCSGPGTTSEDGLAPVQRFGLGFLGELATSVGEIFGGEQSEPLQQGAAACSERPTVVAASPVPVDILADTALEFSQKIKGALGGNAHMTPSFTYAPDVDEKGKIVKVNLTVTTSIVRPRFAGGRPTPEQRILIKRLEDLITAHEERHRDIARSFAQQAVCAALGKTGKDYEGAIKKVLCQMNKAQEELDHREGTVRWTFGDGSTQVIDVGLAPEPSASYPCT